MLARLLAAVLVAGLFTPAPARAWPDGNEEVARKVKIASQEFAQKKEQAKKQAIKAFDLAISRVRTSSGLTAPARADRLREIESAKKLFADSERFPSEYEYAAIELRYYLAVNKAFAPLLRIVDSVIDEAIKEMDKEQEEGGLKMRADLLNQLPGNKLSGPSLWHGTLHRPNGSTIPYHLRIHKMGAGGSFTGHVEDNPGVAGNWGYDVAGQVSGLGVEYALTKSTRGNFTAVRGIGIVSGDRMIVELAQATKGKAGNKVLVVLHRVK